MWYYGRTKLSSSLCNTDMQVTLELLRGKSPGSVWFVLVCVFLLFTVNKTNAMTCIYHKIQIHLHNTNIHTFFMLY